MQTDPGGHSQLGGCESVGPRRLVPRQPLRLTVFLFCPKSARIIPIRLYRIEDPRSQKRSGLLAGPDLPSANRGSTVSFANREANMYFFYILKSKKTGAYYIGSTSNLSARVAKHNRGEVRSTRPYLPWRLQYSEACRSLREARKKEHQVKGWKSRKAIERLLNKSSAAIVPDSALPKSRILDRQGDRD